MWDKLFEASKQNIFCSPFSRAECKAPTPPPDLPDECKNMTLKEAKELLKRKAKMAKEGRLQELEDAAKAQEEAQAGGGGGGGGEEEGGPGGPAVPEEPQGSAEFGSPKFFYLCGVGGALSCGLTHLLVTPLDLVKCRIQTNPEKYPSLWCGLKVVHQEDGLRGLVQGWAPTFMGYSLQGALKFGLYEYFKIRYSELVSQEAAYEYRTLLYLAASASAEFFADIALCPFESVKVKIQTVECYASTFREAVPKMIQEEGYGAFYKSLVPLWMRQIPYTMMKFACFERTIEALYAYVVPKSREECSYPEQLLVTFAAGYIAGVFCAVVSHPADTIVSKMNNEGTGAGAALRSLGFGGLWKGLGARIIMIGTLTGLQWFIYDGAKVALGIPRPPPPTPPGAGDDDGCEPGEGGDEDDDNGGEEGDDAKGGGGGGKDDDKGGKMSKFKGDSKDEKGGKGDKDKGGKGDKDEKGGKGDKDKGKGDAKDDKGGKGDKDKGKGGDKDDKGGKGDKDKGKGDAKDDKGGKGDKDKGKGGDKDDKGGKGDKDDKDDKGGKGGKGAKGGKGGKDDKGDKGDKDEVDDKGDKDDKPDKPDKPETSKPFGGKRRVC